MDRENEEDQSVKIHEIKFDEYGIMDDGLDESTNDQLAKLKGIGIYATKTAGLAGMAHLENLRAFQGPWARSEISVARIYSFICNPCHESNLGARVFCEFFLYQIETELYISNKKGVERVTFIGFI